MIQVCTSHDPRGLGWNTIGGHICTWEYIEKNLLKYSFQNKKPKGFDV